MVLFIGIQLLPKLSRSRSILDAPTSLARILRRNINEGKIDTCVVKRILKDEIYSDHKNALSCHTRLWNFNLGIPIHSKV